MHIIPYPQKYYLNKKTIMVNLSHLGVCSQYSIISSIRQWPLWLFIVYNVTACFGLIMPSSNHFCNTQLQLAMKILFTTKTALRTNLHERGTEVFKWFSLCQNVLNLVASSQSIYTVPNIPWLQLQEVSANSTPACAMRKW
jgi:hypothetical protein